MAVVSFRSSARLSTSSLKRDSVPKIYDALQVDGTETTLEVQQQLGDGVVRTIAMGSTEGLKRGLNVTNTNAPISVPVGTATLRSYHGRSWSPYRRSWSSCN